MSILTKILLDGLGGLASAATLYETGKGVYADIKKHQKTSEDSFLKVTADKPIVERVIDRARQAFLIWQFRSYFFTRAGRNSFCCF